MHQGGMLRRTSLLDADCITVYKPTPTGNTTARAMTRRNISMSARVEVELDIFSGMPNPMWVLTNAEADSFVKQLTKLPRTLVRELSGNLGYRGFIVQVTQGADKQLIRIQTGIVHMMHRPTTGTYNTCQLSSTRLDFSFSCRKDAFKSC